MSLVWKNPNKPSRLQDTDRKGKAMYRLKKKQNGQIDEIWKEALSTNRQAHGMNAANRRTAYRNAYNLSNKATTKSNQPATRSKQESDQDHLVKNPVKAKRHIAALKQHQPLRSADKQNGT